MSTVFVVASFVAVSAITPRLASAASAPVTQASPKANTKPTDTKTTKPAVYAYVAQPNDTYSQMARKAIQAFAKDNKIKLSNAQIIAAETNITQADGSPFLTVGQKIEVKQSTVKTWVEKAQKLTVAQESAWNNYTAGVNFDTSAVGVAK